MITAEIQSLAQGAIVELFEIDLSQYGVNSQFFHAGTNGLNIGVTWRGQLYQPLPIEVEGFEVSAASKTLPRPKLRLANVSGLFSAEVAAFDDLIGGKITRRRTFVKYLDAVNFPGGNPDANPDQSFPDDIWFVEQKTSENKYLIEWELASAFDLQGVMLPRRQIIRNGCPFGYRVWRPLENKFDYSNAGDCGYAGTAMFDKDDNPTADKSQDFCSKHLGACEKRHPAPVSVPFGGFPGAVAVQ